MIRWLLNENEKNMKKIYNIFNNEKVAPVVPQLITIYDKI